MCPADPSQTLGIKLPFLVMIIKNLKKYFTFEVQVSHSETSSGFLLWHLMPHQDRSRKSKVQHVVDHFGDKFHEDQ